MADTGANDSYTTAFDDVFDWTTPLIGVEAEDFSTWDSTSSALLLEPSPGCIRNAEIDQNWMEAIEATETHQDASLCDTSGWTESPLIGGGGQSSFESMKFVYASPTEANIAMDDMQMWSEFMAVTSVLEGEALNVSYYLVHFLSHPC